MRFFKNLSIANEDEWRLDERDAQKAVVPAGHRGAACLWQALAGVSSCPHELRVEFLIKFACLKAKIKRVSLERTERVDSDSHNSAAGRIKQPQRIWSSAKTALNFSGY